nr:MAG TPA: hypothetical protein [Caudoviricetes sp.]
MFCLERDSMQAARLSKKEKCQIEAAGVQQ